MSCTDVLIGHRQNCTHGASGLIVCCVSGRIGGWYSAQPTVPFLYSQERISQLVVALKLQDFWRSESKSLGILLHGQDNYWILHSCLRAYMISSQATGIIAGEDTGGIKTVQLSGQAGWMLATLGGSPQAGQLLGELERLPEGKAMSDPSHWLGWEHYRHWKRAVGRWNQTIDVPDARRSDRQLKKLVRSLQIKFEGQLAHGLVSVVCNNGTLTALCRSFTMAARSRPCVGSLCPQHAHDPRRSHAHLSGFQRQLKAGCVPLPCAGGTRAPQGMDWGAPACNLGSARQRLRGAAKIARSVSRPCVGSGVLSCHDLVSLHALL